MKKSKDINTQTVKGFTLIEVLISMVVAMVIIGGLLLNFISQSSQYRYQDKRGDVAQDMEFALRFIAQDFKAALISVTAPLVGGVDAATLVTIAKDGNGVNPTTYLGFYVWSNDVALNPVPVAPVWRVRRCYVYDNSSGGWMVKYDRSEPNCASGIAMNAGEALIGEALPGNKGMQVTHFRVFQDGLAADDADRPLYADIPDPLPAKAVYDVDGGLIEMPAFTILLEVEVDAAYKGSAIDVFGNAVANNKKRLWRYVQVYPSTIVE